MSNKEAKPQNTQSDSSKKIVEVKPTTQTNIFEGSQKANTVTATPVSQISNPDPFASIMAPKPVAQIPPPVVEVPPSPPAPAPAPATTNPAPAKSSNTTQKKSD